MTEPISAAAAAEKLKAAGSVLILCHKNPDGDTAGCASALYHVLRALDKQAAVLCADTLPASFAFAAPELFCGQFEPELVVAVDVASAQLLGEGPYMDRYSRRVDLCIDHHAGNTGYAQYTLLDAGATAAAMPLTELIEALGVALSPPVASCLYAGLATDSGCFRYANTTAQAHRLAARLIEAGADVEALNTAFFAARTPGQMEAERIARNHLEYHHGGRSALLWLTRDEIAACGVQQNELEELASLPIGVAGVRVGLTLRQQPGGSWRVSIRTAKGTDACAIARRLGGGGHARAAGCELLGSLENAKAALLAELSAVLDGAPEEEACRG